MPATKLKEFLDAKSVKYSVLAHSAAYTAQEIASLTHIRGQELAKTVIVKVDSRMAMAVLPASRQVDLSLLKGYARARTASLAAEDEFRDLFPVARPAQCLRSAISTTSLFLSTKASAKTGRSLSTAALTRN